MGRMTESDFGYRHAQGLGAAWGQGFSYPDATCWVLMVFSLSREDFDVSFGPELITCLVIVSTSLNLLGPLPLHLLSWGNITPCT